MSQHQDIFTHAADLLEAHARTLRRSYTIPGSDGVWTDPAAQADHDEHQNTAISLRAYSDIAITKEQANAR